LNPTAHCKAKGCIDKAKGFSKYFSEIMHKNEAVWELKYHNFNDWSLQIDANSDLLGQYPNPLIEPQCTPFLKTGYNGYLY